MYGRLQSESMTANNGTVNLHQGTAIGKNKRQKGVRLHRIRGCQRVRNPASSHGWSDLSKEHGARARQGEIIGDTVETIWGWALE